MSGVHIPGVKPVKAFGKIRVLVIASSLILLGLGALLLHPKAGSLLTEYFGKGELPPVEFENLEPSLATNHFLVCPENLCRVAQTNHQAKVYEASVGELRDAMLSHLDASPYYRRRSMNLSIQQFEFTERQPMMRFPDVITMRFLELEEGRSTVAIYSRSVLGYGDSGRNQSRVERLLEVLEPFARN